MTDTDSRFHPGSRPDRVLAIDPEPRGFGFAVVESNPIRLIDWGKVDCRFRPSTARLAKVQGLVDRYDVSAVVTEDCRGAMRLRAQAAQPFVNAVQKHFRKRSTRVVLYPRKRILQRFTPLGAKNKLEIAGLLAEEFPELACAVPPARKPWTREHYQMTVFDAVALAITHLTRHVK
jgi:Holliday junction resolvasome RuvABC endonuclease subunit